MRTTCNVLESETCYKCGDRVCSKSSLIEHIVFSGDARKIAGLNDVMSKYDLAVKDYIAVKAERRTSNEQR